MELEKGAVVKGTSGVDRLGLLVCALSKILCCSGVGTKLLLMVFENSIVCFFSTGFVVGFTW